MARDEKLDHLKRVPLFARMGRRELERLGQLADEVADTTRALSEARTRMLAALEVASRRYPWAAPWKATVE